MKKSLILLCLLFLSFPALALEKPRIAVLDLKAESISATDAAAISRFLRNNLSNSDILTVLERSSMEEILSEQKLQLSGCTSSECAVKIGRILNVNKMIVGSIGEFAKKFYIEIRYVDVETSSIDFSEKVNFNRLEDADTQCNVLSDRIIDRVKSKISSYKDSESKPSFIDESKKGTLTLTTGLPGVKIFIGTEDKGTITENSMKLTLPCGKYQVTAKKDDYYTMFTKEVIIYDSAETNEKIELTRKKGTLKINTSPLTGVKIYLDETKKPTGTTDETGIFTLKDINTGLHRVLLTKEKYHDWTDSKEVIYLDEVELKANMEPLPGKIMVITQPSRCEIYLDNNKAGVSNSSGTLTIINVKADMEHTITAKLTGYEETEKRITLEPAGSGNLTFDLKKQQKETMLFLVKYGGKYGYINNKGEVVIPYKFDTAWGFYEGIAGVKVGEKCGFIEKTGKMVISAQFDDISGEYGENFRFSEGLAKVKIEDKYGYIDKTGKMVIPAQFNTAWDFSEGLAQIVIEKKWGYMDKTGKIVIPTIFDNAAEFSDGLASVRIGDKCGYIDKTGKMVIPAQFNGGFNFSEGLASVNINYKCGYINKTGKIVIPCQLDPMSISEFSEGLANIQIEFLKKYGYIDKTGKIVISIQADMAEKFSEGLAIVSSNHKFGYIDKTGKLVIPYQFDGAGHFSEGIAPVSVGDKSGYIDKTGKYIWESTEFVAKNAAVSADEETGKYANMVYIPAGEFIMGSPKGEGADDEHPRHKVYLDAYWIDKYEVTNQQYAEFLNKYGKYTDATANTMIYEDGWGVKKSGGRWQSQTGNENYPVIGVTWYGASQYANFYGMRLPTEEEWEKACRAGSSSKYCFGDLESELNEYAWYSANSGNITHPVGTKKPNIWGVYDMHGNVQEWCADWYDDIYYGFKDILYKNSTGPASGFDRVIRGGDYDVIADDCRSANRDYYGPDQRSGNYGFRCASGVVQGR